MDINRRTLRLDQPSPKVVLHTEVVGLFHVVGVVDTTPISAMMASRVVSSAVKRKTSLVS